MVLFILFFTSCTNFKTQSQFEKNLQELPALIPYRVRDKWGFSNKDKKIVIPAIYDWVDFFNEGLARVALNGKVGFIDTQGNMVAKSIYDWSDNFNNGLAAVSLNRKMGYIDKKGHMVIDPIFEEAFHFDENVA
ncbi:MAG: WG repeat-containing protein, partial [Caldiserica bacterium]|nr:WG repeat-containing protein [Caldisericota bacterium]